MTQLFFLTGPEHPFPHLVKLPDNSVCCDPAEDIDCETGDLITIRPDIDTLKPVGDD